MSVLRTTSGPKLFKFYQLNNLTHMHLLTSNIPELCRRKDLSHLGQTPVLSVKWLHHRYIGTYFSMSHENSFMGFIFFKR